MAIGMRRMEEINHQHAPPLSKLQSTVSKIRMSLTDVTLKYSCCFSFNHNLALWISVFVKDLVPRWALLRVWSPRFIAGLSEEEVDFFRFLGGEGLQIRKPSQIEQGNKVNTGKNKGLYDYCILLYFFVYIYMSGGQNYLITPRNGHGQSGWPPIGCEGLMLCEKIGYRQVGGPLSFVKVFTQIWTSQVHSLLL